MIFEDAHTLVVSKFHLGTLKIDLTRAKLAESRNHETAYVNRETAQELMSMYVSAYTDVREGITRVKYEYVQTLQAAEERKSILILEVIPEEAVKRGVATKASPSGSEDFRNAVVNRDEEYQRLTRLANSLRAAFEFLSDKAKAFEMSYQQIKKVYSNNDLEDHGLRSDNNSGVDGVGVSRY